MTAPPLAYRWVSRALAVPIALYSLRRALRDGGADYLRQRYGFVPKGARAPVWIHCASVGEVSAALPLIEELGRSGATPILLSTNTPTGQRYARAHAPADTRAVYLPVDRPGPVARFLDRVRPRAALIVETELWPHLFAGLVDRDIPIALVNARLSPRSTGAPAWWRRSAAWCLQRTALILARSETDRERLVALGAPPERLEVAGNLKWAAAGPLPEPIALGRRYVLAASTHDDEEVQLSHAWTNAVGGDPLLVIAPRHPERGAAIARALARDGLTMAQRSRGESPAGAAVYVADTLGELMAFMAGAELVIMGGSLIPHGGQNVVEPARAGRAILAGPHMGNFAEETAALEAAGAMVRADDAPALVDRARALLDDAAARAAMGAAGRAWLDSAAADMAERYRRRLSEGLPGWPEGGDGDGDGAGPVTAQL